MIHWRRLLATACLALLAAPVLAIDYRSVDVPAAILYDSPSLKGKKLYLIKAQTLVVTAARAEIRESDKAEAAVLAELDKWVAVEFIEPAAPGWAKIRHRDGITGFV